MSIAFVHIRFILMKDILYEFWSFTGCIEKRRGCPWVKLLMINPNHFFSKLFRLAILLMAEHIRAPIYPCDHTLRAN